MPSLVRAAEFGDERAIADLLFWASRDKSHPKICLSRAHDCVRRSRKAKGGCFCFLALETDTPIGFLYAQERHAFDLAANIIWVEVCFLTGRNCMLDLLNHLRDKTHKRILVPSWACFGKLEAFGRLLKPMNPKLAGQWHEI